MPCDPLTDRGNDRASDAMQRERDEERQFREALLRHLEETIAELRAVRAELARANAPRGIRR